MERLQRWQVKHEHLWNSFKTCLIFYFFYRTNNVICIKVSNYFFCSFYPRTSPKEKVVQNSPHYLSKFDISNQPNVVLSHCTSYSTMVCKNSDTDDSGKSVRYYYYINILTLAKMTTKINLSTSVFIRCWLQISPRRAAPPRLNRSWGFPAGTPGGGGRATSPRRPKFRKINFHPRRRQKFHRPRRRRVRTWIPEGNRSVCPFWLRHHSIRSSLVRGALREQPFGRCANEILSRSSGRVALRHCWF